MSMTTVFTTFSPAEAQMIRSLLEAEGLQAEVKNELCSACHVRIRPQVYAELLRNEEIHVCDSCSRILFSRESL